ncbi:uncharacterized protein [Pleurodeles waltl]|uniref:uncharacterized protein n=1 Tax=Pleurodeles waltl TaxID=8319 RepID=UPI003709503D
MGLFRWSLGCLSLLLWTQVVKGQSFMMRNVHLEKCVHVAQERVSLAECKPHSVEQRWTWDSDARAIVSLKGKKCLGVSKMNEFAMVKLEPCGGQEWQRWICTKKGHMMLYGQGLYLNAKHGTNKIFISREKDKLSKWRTLSNDLLCSSAGDMERYSQVKVVELAGTPVLFYEPKVISTSEQTEALSESSWTKPTASTPLSDYNSTAMEGKIENLIADDVTNWKLGMLILSPLAFTTGLLILVLNIHCNKKRKTLGALKSYPQTWHGVNLSDEKSPLAAKEDLVQHGSLASCSPSLKHGEILIEWKDGTVTPLFDNSCHPTN